MHDTCLFTFTQLSSFFVLVHTPSLVAKEKKRKEISTLTPESRSISKDFVGTRANEFKKKKGLKNTCKKHTTIGIRWWSPTQLLIDRSTAYVWQSGRDAQLFVVYGRMCH